MASSTHQAQPRILNEGSTVHALIWQHLGRKDIRLFPELAYDTANFALLCANAGLDHLLGEQAMAFGDQSVKGKFQVYFLVTDRQICGCLNERRFQIAYRDIQAVRAKPGILLAELKVQTGNLWHDIAMGDFYQGLAGFLQALAQTPPRFREPPPRPLCEPGHGDPSGAETALARLPYGEPRTEILLMYVGEMARRGIMPELVARDFTARIVLHYRNAVLGRGMSQGWMLSPLSAQDLSALFFWSFGAPLSMSDHPVRICDFALPTKSNLAGAAASTALGLASLAAFGIGWVSAPGKSPPKEFRLAVTDRPACACFRINGPRSELSLVYEGPNLLGKLLGMLLEHESALLLRRVVTGWSASTEELAAMPFEEAARRLQEVLGPIDPRVFTPPPVG
jgi:hypothetical protein